MHINAIRFNKTLSEVLKQVTPSKKEIEDVSEYSNEIMGRLKLLVGKDVEIILAGSVARGTQIKGKSDIDIFLLFPKYLEEREMESKALELAKKAVIKSKGERYEINYAEHPYLKLINDSRLISADIVPAFKILDSSERASAVDRTQLHNLFVLKNLNSKQKNEVRALKYLFQRHNIYGAESSRHAFSGYLSELLIAHYHTLPRLLEHIAETKLPLFIDVKNGTELSGNHVGIEYSKRFNAPLIVIDPTDQNRNVAASVSLESISRFILISRELANDPSINTFYGYKYSEDEQESGLDRFIKSSGLETDVLCFNLPKISEDTLWPQLEKLRNRLLHEAEVNGLSVELSFSRIEARIGVITFFHNSQKIHIRKIRGPEVTIPAASEAFIKSHSGNMKLSVEGSNVVALEKPRYDSIGKMLLKMLHDRDFVFAKDIKKGSCKAYGLNVPAKFKPVIYHGLAEKLNI